MNKIVRTKAEAEMLKSMSLIRALFIATLVIALVLFSAGCQSKATSARFEQAQQFVFACQNMAMQTEIAKASAPKAQFADPRDQLLSMAIERMSAPKGSMMQECDDFYIAMINGDSKKMSSIVNGGFGLAKGVLALIGVGIVTDGLVDLAGSNSGSYTFRDVNMNNAAGAGGIAGEGGIAGVGGAANQTFNIGGNTNLLGPNSSQISAEKFQDASGQSGNPLLDDSGDGSDNNPGFFN